MSANPLRPVAPETPWTRERASHLLRRAGFCPSEQEIREAVDAGLAPTVERLVTGGEQSSEHDELDALGDRLAAGNKIEQVRAWWVGRMVLSSRPLAMRMSVFWHDHFATSNVKVRSAPMMYRQLRTIEAHAVGSFGDLLLAMSRDPAMIVWLDGNDNVKGRPNENFARELFELFSLGLGAYTESDIKEAARAFTGWGQRHGRFVFSRLSHDDGVKQVLGERGELSGEDVVRVCLEQPACARFIGTKLVKEFVTPTPDEALIKASAAVLLENDYDIGETLRVLLSSEAMFDERHVGARIKSPVELAIGLTRSLELHPAPSRLAESISQMGQRLLEPASVKGWDGGRDWINATTMLVRMNAGVAATTPGGPAKFNPKALRGEYGLNSREAIFGYARGLTVESSEIEIEAIEAEGDDLLSRSLRLLVTSPEYQLG